ncbi:uncharacterized protein LOC110013074 [Sesamum indicum]|uniref:Uncharacterized protein LOC110013074 n=1 Tax=Sesamum indicum TaxID=4182 RepID=A0A8M8V5K5_SESIN|nr:uncharacterized protein LOC110013074 [Sesamum indicum]
MKEVLQRGLVNPGQFLVILPISWGQEDTLREKKMESGVFNLTGEEPKRVLGENQVSLRSCTEINSLKGNVVLNISRVPSENRDLSVPDLSSGFEMDSAEGHCLKGSKVHGEYEDIKTLDLDGGTGRQIINEMDFHNALVDSCEIGGIESDAFPSMDKIANGDHTGPELKDLERGRAVNSVASEADGRCSKSDTLESANKNCHPLEKNALNLVSAEANDEVGDNFSADTSRIVSETGGDCLHEGKDFDADESKPSLEYTQSEINEYQNDQNDHNANNLVLSQCGSIDCTVLPESQESRIFGAEGSTELKKGNECAYVGVGTSSLRACSCSFCTKGIVAFNLLSDCCFSFRLDQYGKL